MKCPKYVKDLCYKRAHAAAKFVNGSGPADAAEEAKAQNKALHPANK